MDHSEWLEDMNVIYPLRFSKEVLVNAFVQTSKEVNELNSNQALYHTAIRPVCKSIELLA